MLRKGVAQGPVFTGVKGLYFAQKNNHSTSPLLEGAGGGGGPPGWNLDEPHTFGTALSGLCSPIPGLAWVGGDNGGTNGGIETPRDPQGDARVFTTPSPYRMPGCFSSGLRSVL